MDGITIRDIEQMPAEKYIRTVQKKLAWYKPKPVKRVEIPKPNGGIRPLGIPTMFDRLVQQSIKQVLEPICEANFMSIAMASGQIGRQKMQSPRFRT